MAGRSRGSSSLLTLPRDGLRCIALSADAALDALAFVCTSRAVLAAVLEADLTEWREIVALSRDPRARLAQWNTQEFLGNGNNGNGYIRCVLGTTPTCRRLTKLIPVRPGQTAVMQISEENDEEGVPVTELRKVSLLRRLQRHENVLTFIDVMHFEHVDGMRRMHVCTEYIQYDLLEYARLPPASRGGRTAAACVKSLTRQLLDGLAHCHDRSVMHRNLKPQVLRVTPDGAPPRVLLLAPLRTPA